MFKLKQAKKKIEAPASASKRAKSSAKPAAKSSARPKPAAAKKPGAKALPKHDAKALPKRGAKVLVKGPGGKPLPSKGPKGKGSRTTPTRDLVLRKRQLAPRVDIGVGPQSVEPAQDTPSSIGLSAANAAIDKKATDVVLLDVREVSGLCDQMLVVTARSVPHLQAVAEGVEEALRKEGQRVIHRDGLAGSEPDWVLLDYGDLMVHVFRPEARESYGLEAYYGQARLIGRWKND